jgi:phenylpropionate dioxygenase-like ring-hydroxylating dioxygenase large terminal subunit
LDGKLTKAPRFTEASVEDFDPSKIDLFPIHVHVDRNGFVYVNLDARELPEISWQGQYGQLDRQDVLLNSVVNWDNVEYDMTWIKNGSYNWKLMQDNYNECYHCLTAHPDVARTTVMDTYVSTNYVEYDFADRTQYVSPSTNHISHHNEPKPSVFTKSAFDATRFAGRSATHVFPGSHFSPNPGTGFMHLMRSIPTSATTTRQEYDVYRLTTPHATPEAHARMTAFYRKVVDEDFTLCEAVQKNIERGIFQNGQLHPFHEEGVMAFQNMVLDVLKEQVQLEKEAGRELWAAKPGFDGKAGGKGGGLSKCEELLGCEKGQLEDIAW